MDDEVLIFLGWAHPPPVSSTHLLQHTFHLNLKCKKCQWTLLKYFASPHYQRLANNTSLISLLDCQIAGAYSPSLIFVHFRTTKKHMFAGQVNYNYLVPIPSHAIDWISNIILTTFVLRILCTMLHKHVQFSHLAIYEGKESLMSKKARLISLQTRHRLSQRTVDVWQSLCFEILNLVMVVWF